MTEATAALSFLFSAGSSVPVTGILALPDILVIWFSFPAYIV